MGKRSQNSSHRDKRQRGTWESRTFDALKGAQSSLKAKLASGEWLARVRFGVQLHVEFSTSGDCCRADATRKFQNLSEDMVEKSRYQPVVCAAPMCVGGCNAVNKQLSCEFMPPNRDTR